MVKKNIDVVIKEIAERLFTNGSGEKAKRLVLELENNGAGGGWSKLSVENQIREALENYHVFPKEK